MADGPEGDDPPAGGWLEVHDAVLGGLNHALSNRVAAASALAAVTEPDEPPGAEIASSLVTEAASLEALLRLYRRLPRAAGGKAVPLQVGEVLPVAAQLYGHGASRAREAPCTLAVDAGVLPVVAPEDALTHALVALLYSAGRWALGAERGSTTAHVAGTAEIVVVTVTGTRDAGAALLPGADAAPLAAAPVARWLLRGAEAELVDEGDGGGVRYTLRMPTLLAVRARGVGAAR